jgi:hypothetical protein
VKSKTEFTEQVTFMSEFLCDLHYFLSNGDPKRKLHSVVLRELNALEREFSFAATMRQEHQA